ncbi:MAG: hypothetical protein ACOYYS_12380 [Chloroflexota bacterium]
MKFTFKTRPLPYYLALTLRIGLLYTVLYILLVLLLAPLGETALGILSSLVPVLVGGAAFYFALLAWRVSHPSQKRAWQWLMVGIAMWWVAEVIWAIAMHWDIRDILAWLADFCWMGGYLPIGLSCIFFLRANRFELTPFKEVVAVVGGGLLPMLVFVGFVYPCSGAARFELPVHLVWSALYPAFDILIATGGLLCLMVSGPKPWRRPWFLIGAALVTFAYTDLWYWLLEFFGINEVSAASIVRVDIPYGLAYVILAVGCCQVVADERAAKTRPVSDLRRPPNLNP